MTTTPGAFTYLEVEAALCVWECLNDWTLLDSKLTRPEWIALREGVGAAEMRHQSIALGQWCLAVHAICTADDPDFFDGVAYDWDVIPMILAHARNADGPVIYVEALTSAESVAALVTAEHKRNEWMRLARFEAQRQFGYADLIADHADRTAQACEAGEAPAAFVSWLGEKYDLARVAH